MCWRTNSKPIKQIAEEDIPVFKVMKQCNDKAFSDNNLFKKLFSKHLTSLYRDYLYEEGEAYYFTIGKIIQITNKCYGINEGIHSYSNDCEIAIEYSYYLIPEVDYIVNITFNSNLLEHYPIYSFYNLVKVNCIIPKGSEYYLNERGEYVSNQIKIIDYNVLGL